MVIPYNKNLKELSKSLRNNQTEAEQRLWTRLRLKHLGYTFYRQKPIGDYIVDFYCPKARLVIEIDGGQHFSEETAEYDRTRTDYLQSLGLEVLRFTNSEVLKNTDSVAEIIYGQVGKILLNPPLRKRDKSSIKRQ